MKASHRHELKHDKFVDSVVSFWTEVRNWLAPHKKIAVVAGCILVVLLLFYAGSALYWQSKTREAWAALEKERSKAEKGEGQPAYVQLAETYKGTEAEPWILFYQASHELESIDGPSAEKSPEELNKTRNKVIQALESLRQRHPRHVLAIRSTILIAQQYSDLKEWKKAAEYYREVANSDSDLLDRFLKQEAKFWLAYALEAQGDVPQAESLYSDLSALEMSRWGDLAKYRLERLHASGN